MNRKFIAYYLFVRWDCLSFGIHLCLTGPHVEIHLPFGFIRIGWSLINKRKPLNYENTEKRKFGYTERYIN